MDATQRIHDIASRNDLPMALPGALSLVGYAAYWHQDDGSTDEITGPALCANLDDARATGHLYGQPHTAGEMIMARTIAMHEPRITAIWHTAMFPNLPGNGILLGQGADGVMRAWICSIHECDSCNHCVLNQVTDNLFVRSIRNHGFLLDEGTNNAYLRIGGLGDARVAFHRIMGQPNPLRAMPWEIEWLYVVCDPHGRTNPFPPLRHDADGIAMVDPAALLRRVERTHSMDKPIPQWVISMLSGPTA